jgi:large-conductance mechanosensitive channel
MNTQSQQYNNFSPQKIINKNIDVAHWTFQKLKTDFQEFAFSNQFVARAAGVSVGVATKEIIINILNKVILPILYLLGKLIFKPKIYHLFKEYHNIINPIAEFIWDVIQWLIIVIVTFIVLEYFFNRKFLGFKTFLSDEDKKKFEKAKENINESVILIKNKDIENYKLIHNHKNQDKETGI